MPKLRLIFLKVDGIELETGQKLEPKQETLERYEDSKIFLIELSFA